MHDRGGPPIRYVRQAPDHRVTYDALAPVLSAPPILTHHLAGQDGPITSYTLTRHFQSEAIQARERAQIRAIKGSIGHVEVFQMDDVAIFIVGRPRPQPGHGTPNPAHNTYTPKCEEPLFIVFHSPCLYVFKPLTNSHHRHSSLSYVLTHTCKTYCELSGSPINASTFCSSTADSLR